MASSPLELDSDQYLGLYREALANHEEHILYILKGMVWINKLTRLNPKALTQDELRNITTTHDHSDFDGQAREIITLIRQKDTLDCYIGLSRALCDSTKFKTDDVFPFVADLKRTGRHPPIERVAGGKGIQQIHNVAVANILWLIQSREDFDKIPSLLTCTSYDPSNETRICNFLLKTVSIKVEVCPGSSECIDVAINLACPFEPFSGPSCNAFLSGLRPQPRLVLLTAAGTRIRRDPRGDVVVVMRGEPTVVCAEVELVTALWRLERVNKHREANTCIMFGRATSKASHDDPDVLVSSKEVVSFYNAADKLNVATLAVAYLDKHKPYLEYCCKLVHYFSKKYLE